METPENPAPATPEEEVPEIEYAGFQRRNMAMMIDIMVIILLMQIIDPLIRIFYIPAPVDLSNPEWAKQIPVGRILISLILPAIACMLYSLGFWIWKGNTPGKMLIALRIVDSKSGERPARWQWMVRAVGYVVPGAIFFLIFHFMRWFAHPTSILLLFVASMLGFLWVGIDPKKRAWHDYMAHTVVVSDAKPMKELWRRAMQWLRAGIEKIKAHSGR